MEFFATAGNIPVHIIDSGKGDKCILLLHGYLETMSIYDELYNVLTKEYRVIMMDLPGHGLSCSAPVNTMDFCATAAKGVMDYCGVEKAFITGHSLGGYIALAFCKLFPQMAEGLILLNSSPYPDDPGLSESREREINVIEGGKLIPLAAASIPKMYSSSNLRRLDEKIRQTIELCEAHDPEGICASIKGMAQRPDSSEFIKGGSVPVMAILGDADTLIPAEMIERMKKEFPDIQLFVIPNTAHNSFIEDQEKVVQLIDEFTKESC